MASPTRWAWVWVNSGSWWWTGRPGVLWFMGSQRVRHDWATELNWTKMVLLLWKNAVSESVKYRVTLWLINSIPRYIPKRYKYIYPHKNLYIYIYRNIVCNNQKMETIQTSINWWMNKQNVVHPYNGILLSSTKKLRTDTCYNIDEPWKHYAKWKKSATKTTNYKFPLYEITRIWQSIETEDRLVVDPSWGTRERNEKWLLVGIGILLGVTEFFFNLKCILVFCSFTHTADIYESPGSAQYWKVKQKILSAPTIKPGIYYVLKNKFWMD